MRRSVPLFWLRLMTYQTSARRRRSRLLGSDFRALAHPRRPGPRSWLVTGRINRHKAWHMSGLRSRDLGSGQGEMPKKTSQNNATVRHLAPHDCDRFSGSWCPRRHFGRHAKSAKRTQFTLTSVHNRLLTRRNDHTDAFLRNEPRSRILMFTESTAGVMKSSSGNTFSRKRTQFRPTDV